MTIKQRRLTRLAVTFLKRHGLLEYPGPVRRGGHHLARRQRPAADRAFQQRLRGRGGFLKWEGFATPVICRPSRTSPCTRATC